MSNINLRLVIVVVYFSLSIFCNLASLSAEPQDPLKRSYLSAKKWFLAALTESGEFLYLYDVHLDHRLDGNNEIRQLMASRLLAELANESSELQKKHQHNLDFIYQNWLRTKDNYQYILFQGKSKLGANAMALRTLVASPFYEKYSATAEKLKNGILRSVNPDGSMNPFLVEPKYTYDHNYLLTFYSGEALLALVEYYEVKKDPELLTLIMKSQDFYLQLYVDQLEQNYYPAYVPWQTMALNKLYKITKNKKYAAAIFRLNDKLLEMQDQINHPGRFYNEKTPQYGSPHASSDGVYTEGLVYAYEIALELKDQSRVNTYQQALQLAFRNLQNLQYTTENTAYLLNPQAAIGAFRLYRSRPEDPFSMRPGSNVRIDCVQHILDAYRKYFSLRADAKRQTGVATLGQGSLTGNL